MVILVFIALRLARVTNEMGAGMAMKGLATLFGLYVVYFNLDMGAWPVDFLKIRQQGLLNLGSRVSKLPRAQLIGLSNLA